MTMTAISDNSDDNLHNDKSHSNDSNDNADVVLSFIEV